MQHSKNLLLFSLRRYSPIRLRVNNGIFLFISMLFLYGCGSFQKEQKTVDITFFVASDLHFGQNENTAEVNQIVAAEMASLPGTLYPDSSEKVDSPEWISLTGDLTEDGKPEEWDDFTSVFGLNGEGAFPFLIYEGFGNHDGPTSAHPVSPVRNGIKTRNLKRNKIRNISKNGLHYSWSRQGIYFANLNSYPGNEWDPECGWCHFFQDGFREPAFSLDFLKKDLEESVGDSVVLSFHYGLGGEETFSYLWWTSKEKDAFYEVIKDYNVIAIFVGHEHAVKHYQWRGIPVLSAGSTQKTKDDSELDTPGQFMVVRITEDQMYVAERRKGKWGEVFRETLN